MDILNGSREITSSPNEMGRTDTRINATFNPEKRLEYLTYERFSSKAERFDPDKRVERIYTDDNSKIYRIGDNLIPNNTYEINGYQYKTDRFGRIKTAQGELHISNHETRLKIKDDSEVIGKGSQRDTDDRGHLIGDLFNGGNGLENIVPMDRNLNRGTYESLEKKLASAVKEGKHVEYRVNPRYTDNSNRPSSFIVTYKIDGEKTMTVFKNVGADNNV